MDKKKSGRKSKCPSFPPLSSGSFRGRAVYNADARPIAIRCSRATFSITVIQC